MTALDIALTYAAMGLHVFPCKEYGPPGVIKTPYTHNGLNDSTTDPDVIRGWWERWPDALIGVDCGRSGLIVVDLDVKDGKDGPGNWSKFLNGRELPATFNVRTPSGGWHGWYRDGGTAYKTCADEVAEGVDVRAVGGYVLAPGSTGYTWHAEVPLSVDDIPVMPTGILPERNGARFTGHWQNLDRDALDSRDLAALEALENLGGHGAFQAGEYVAVTRPGKTAGASVSIGHIGPGLVKVFTPNWPPLSEGAVYDADQLAALANGGRVGPVVLESDNELSRRVRLTPASSIKPRPVRWLWDTASVDAAPRDRQGRFPEGSLVLAVGRAGLGKSQFAVWMTARITAGTLPGALWGKPRAVVYAASEDSWSMTIVPRLIAAGADLDLVFRVDVEADDDPHARLTLPKDTSLLERALESHSVVLVVLDPLLSLIDGTINDYRAREVREALEPLVAVADRTRATFLGLAHFTKASGSDPLLLISGSGAFGQLIRAGVGFARDEDAEDPAYVLSTIKNNVGREDLPSLAYVIQPCPVDTPDGPTWVSRLEFTGEESERSVRDLLRDNGSPEEKTERNAAQEWLDEYLKAAGGSALAAEVLASARKAGLSEQRITKARMAIKAKSERTGFGKDAFYTWIRMDSMDSRTEKPRIHGIHGESMGGSESEEQWQLSTSRGSGDTPNLDLSQHAEPTEGGSSQTIEALSPADTASPGSGRTCSSGGSLGRSNSPPDTKPCSCGCDRQIPRHHVLAEECARRIREEAQS